MINKMIKKLCRKHECFQFEIKNNLNLCEVPDKEGNIVDIVFEMTVQLIVFKDVVIDDKPMQLVVKKVEGYGSGHSRKEAMDNAKINAINTIGIF